jgi:hypothetical protein
MAKEATNKTGAMIESTPVNEKVAEENCESCEQSKM